MDCNTIIRRTRLCRHINALAFLAALAVTLAALILRSDPWLWAALASVTAYIILSCYVLDAAERRLRLAAARGEWTDAELLALHRAGYDSAIDMTRLAVSPALHERLDMEEPAVALNHRPSLTDGERDDLAARLLELEGVVRAARLVEPARLTAARRREWAGALATKSTHTQGELSGAWQHEITHTG